MLQDFLVAHRQGIIVRCRTKVRTRFGAAPTSAGMDVPTFLDQLVEALGATPPSSQEMSRSAARHGRDLLSQGLSVSQVVHDYGDVCQSISDLALETGTPIAVGDFRTLNRCLDDAIASAVTEYVRESGESSRKALQKREEERFGFLAHEIRNLVNTANLAFDVLKSGNVDTLGSTGLVLKRSLSGLRDLVDRSVAEVRLRNGLQECRPVVVRDLIDELAPAAALEAAARGLQLAVQADEASAVVLADRRILLAIVRNLLHNAFKFTRPATHVVLSVTTSGERVLFAVADECDGLPGEVDELFRPFEQASTDRSGLGLGLAFSRWAAEAQEGRVYGRNLPGHGCVFTLDLPRVSRPRAGAALYSTISDSPDSPRERDFRWCPIR